MIDHTTFVVILCICLLIAGGALILILSDFRRHDPLYEHDKNLIRMLEEQKK